jgi:preprotein translocase subunit SecG
MGDAPSLPNGRVTAARRGLCIALVALVLLRRRRMSKIGTSNTAGGGSSSTVVRNPIYSSGPEL